MYRALVGSPQQEWTVSALHAAVTEGAAVRAEAVRTTLYLLLAEGMVGQVPGRRTLTMCLTGDGAEFLAATLRRWGQASASPTR